MKSIFFFSLMLVSGYVCAQIPLNDDCSGAIDLGMVPFCSSPAQYTNVNATASNIDPQFNIPDCFNNAVERDVWFSFTMPADGSITDVAISVWGTAGNNGTLHMPEVALYRGDCSFGGLAELDCAAAPLNVDEVHLNFLGLQPGETYFLRINDYSATGSANAGTFKLCVEKFVPDFMMGDAPGAETCSGTLWDSGGPANGYSNDENLDFTICPQDFHQCIAVNILDYDTENNFDFLQVFSGSTSSGTLLASFSGSGSSATVYVPTMSCATIHFESDESLHYDGFHLTWTCSPDVCPPPPPTPPAASTCATALSINGCHTDIPNIIHLQPGAGDPDFIQDGVNAGCILNPSFDYNFSFFYFTAMANGQFGFLVKNADANNPADLDFNVWGPIDNIADICDYVSNHQPVRSSWTAAPDFENPEGYTGMTNTNPYNGSPVTDDFDCGGTDTPGQGILPTDDSFVKTLTVQQGKIYVVMLDDYDGVISSEPGVSIDFSPTSPGVLAPDTSNLITITGDTSICAGQSVQLLASGGLAYAWYPYTSLSCGDCANPVATPLANTTYVVQAATTCGIVKDSVAVSLLHLDLGPDPHVCLGASFTLNEHPIPGQYSWIGSPGLSCTDCPSPVFTATQPGIFILICIVTTPSCILADTIRINVAPGQQPQLHILPDTSICNGATLTLGGASIPGYVYTWTSNPPGFSSSQSNPAPVMPAQNTTYYIEVFGNNCVFTRLDSVVVQVFNPPALSLISGATICLGEGVTLGNTSPQQGVSYSWLPDDGTLSDIHAANPVATPLTGGVHTYFLTASNQACSVMQSVSVAVVDLQLDLDVADTVRLCKGNSLTINAIVTPGMPAVSWSPLYNLQLSPDGLQAIASPEHDITYTARANASGCIRTRKVTVLVDSLPPFLNIQPLDTTICSGAQVTLRPKAGDPGFDPSDYPGLTFNWSPDVSLLTPDNALSVTVQPLDSIEYQRITINGVCADTVTAKVNVVDAPAITITSDGAAICSGNTVALSAQAPGYDSLLWSPAATLSCNSCLMPVASPTATTLYTLSGKYHGCTAAQTVEVMVNPRPQYQFPNMTGLCGGAQLVLNSINDPSVTSYHWSSVPAMNIPQVAQPVVTLSGSGVQTVKFYLEADNGCIVHDSFTVTYTNVDLMLAAPDTLCPGIQTQLTASASIGGGTYSWSTGANTQVVFVDPTETTTYTVSYTLNNCVFRDSANIVVQGTTPAIDFPDDATLCPGDSIVLNSTETPGATYQWSSQPALDIPQVGMPPAIPLFQTTNFTVTASLGNCTITKTLKATVLNATLDVTDDLVVCSGIPFTIAATGSATGTYAWTPGGNEASFTDVLNSAQTVHYALLYTYGPPGNECSLTDTVTVVSKPGFNIKIVADPDSSFNAGDEIMLDAVIQPSQNVNGFQFEWLENGVTSVGTTEQVTLKPETIDTSIEYVIYATNTNGCSDTAIIRFRVYQPVVEYPNAFTPNGDGSNDAFGIVITEGKANVEMLEIYDRWGQKVYQSTEPNARWDGTIKGKDAPSDVYVFKVRWRGGDGALHYKSGEVNLLR